MRIWIGEIVVGVVLKGWLREDGDDGRWWIVWKGRVGRMDWMFERARRGADSRGSDAIATVLVGVAVVVGEVKKLRKIKKWRKVKLRLSARAKTTE